ncbi:unnamed protein product [Paramecium sonneborni]|uniref:Major facilitator superfamily (MFS) profile domain-containing protein n=1 Tax=Paramecium sonneborni TaxID=65129 RepID=A0A8S1NP16_9CILI|nr:unnamed protein product [Paramecium sonneborni]
MTSQVLPQQLHESENLSPSNVAQEPSMLLTQPSSKLKSKPPDQSEKEVKEEINSLVHLTIILVAIQSGNFSIGYSLSYLTISFSTLFSQITLKGSEIEEQGLFSAVLSIGQVVGALLTKPLLKYTTRNQSLLIADLFGIISILQVIPNREVILTFRFCYGLCLGISTIIMAVYVKELCPDQYYETFSVLASFLIAGGLFFINFLSLGYLNPDLRGEDSYYWQIIFAIPALLHLFRQLILTVIYKVDSPDSLIQIQMKQKAKEIIKKIYQPQFIDQVFQKCQLRSQENQVQQEGMMNLFNKKHIQTLLIGCLLAFISTWCGLFALYSYSSQIFNIMSDGDLTLNAIFSIILGVVQLIPAFISKFIYRRLGNRPLLLYGLFFLIIFQILIIGLSYSDSYEATIISFIIICFFAFTFALTLGPITFSMTPEINTSEGTYFCFVTLYAWQLLMLYIFPFMLDGIKMSGSFILFGILTFLALIYFYFSVKETKGFNHNEIDNLYGKL